MKQSAHPAKTTSVEALLGILSLGPKTGYAIRQLIGESIGNFWSESFGQIYPALKRMVAEGLVELLDGEETDSRREKKVYKLTERGQERLREWLGMPAERQVMRNELLLKLFFGDRAQAGEMQALVRARRELLAADLARYEAIEKDLKARHTGHPGLPFWLMTVRYGMADARALIAWCDECLAKFEEMR